MAWARLESSFYANPKIQRLSEGAFRLYVLALTWSVEHLTDGYIPESSLVLIGAPVKRQRVHRLVTELISVGLFIHSPNEHQEGWRIHDYEKYQPTKAQVERERALGRERVKRFRNGVTEGARNGVSNAAPYQTRPDTPKSPAELGTDQPRASRANGTNPRARQKNERQRRAAISHGRNRARAGLAIHDFEAEITRDYRDQPHLAELARASYRTTLEGGTHGTAAADQPA